MKAPPPIGKKFTVHPHRLNSGTALNIFLEIEQQAKENTVLYSKANNDTFECGLHLTERVCITKKDTSLNIALSKLLTVSSKL